MSQQVRAGAVPSAPHRPGGGGRGRGGGPSLGAERATGPALRPAKGNHMRALTRTLVSVTTAVGIAAGTLGVAGTAAAAPAA
ncbi:peptidoglycan-binding protein, partial [Streptomyces sp. ZG43]